MYLQFDIKKDKDLIVLNYYIEQNLHDDNIVNLSATSVAQVLQLDRTKAHRLIKKLEELNIIRCINRATGGKSISSYKYLIKSINETVNEMNNETIKPIKNEGLKTISKTDNETDNELDKYGKAYKEFNKRSSKEQILRIQGIEGIKKVDLELFNYLLSIIEDDVSIKNRYRYFIQCLKNTIKNNIFTVNDYENDQEQKKSNKASSKWNYEDDSREDDFDFLAKQSRSR